MLTYCESLHLRQKLIARSEGHLYCLAPAVRVAKADRVMHACSCASEILHKHNYLVWAAPRHPVQDAECIERAISVAALTNRSIAVTCQITRDMNKSLQQHRVAKDQCAEQTAQTT